MTRSVCFLLPAAALLALAACGGTPTVQTTPEPVPQVTQDGGNASTAAPPAGGDIEAGRKYFTAILSSDPEEETDAMVYASENSIAAAYLQHRINIDNADTDSGNVQDPYDLIEDNGNFGYCPDGDTDSKDCVMWENLRYDQGKLVDFTTNGKVLKERITLGSGDAVKAGGLAQVTFLSAYQSPSTNSVYVTFKVKTGDKKVTVAAYDATYRSPDGRQSTSSSSGGPSDIDKNSTATVYSVFKRAKPGGTIKLQIFDNKTFEGPTLKIKTA